jgi:hypothetical protein
MDYRLLSGVFVGRALAQLLLALMAKLCFTFVWFAFGHRIDWLCEKEFFCLFVKLFFIY